MKNKIVKFGKWAERNWLALVIFALVIMLVGVIAVMASWFVGFWANALAGTKFDLGSCWQGIGVIIAGLGGITALAKAAWTKYDIDSRYNSIGGLPPKDEPYDDHK